MRLASQLSILRGLLLTLTVGAFCPAAFALSNEAVRAMAVGDSDGRIAAINRAAGGGDPGVQAFFQAMLDNQVQVAGDDVFIVRDGKATDAASGLEKALPA